MIATAVCVVLAYCVGYRYGKRAANREATTAALVQELARIHAIPCPELVQPEEAQPATALECWECGSTDIRGVHAGSAYSHLCGECGNRFNWHGPSGAAGEAQPSEKMPEIHEGDVVDLDGFHLRPVLPRSMHALQGNDGVRAIYRCVWRRDEAQPSDDGVSLIAAERRRQIEAEGWTLDHDELHNDGTLAVNAARLAVDGTDAQVDDLCDRDDWGLPAKHHANRVRQLVIAGALIAAEIDRVQQRDRVGEARPAQPPQGEK